MAKSVSGNFYHTKEWKRTREYIMQKYHGICQRCKVRPAKIVHHNKVYLNDSNVDNYDIAHGEWNLIPLCQQCHNSIHYGDGDTSIAQDGLVFDSNGRLVQTKPDMTTSE